MIPGRRPLPPDLLATVHRLLAAIPSDVLAAVDQRTIDAVCQEWCRGGRDPMLGELIRRAGWVATGPLKVEIPPNAYREDYSPRVLTALHTERLDLLADATPEWAHILVTAADDEEPPLRDRARDALLALRREDAREAVCELAVTGGSAAALDAAVAASFTPAAAERRAVLLFLAEDFERYAELDFDGRLLASAYATAHPHVRARLAETGRAAGRVDWARVVVDRPSVQAAELTDDEWETAVRVLVGAQHWAELWRLALTTPAMRSVRILRELDRHRWLPENESQRLGCAELIALAKRCVGDHPPARAFRLATAPADHMSAHDGYVMDPNGKVIVCATHNPAGGSGIRVWHPPSTPHGLVQTPRIEAMAITPDGQRLVTAHGFRLDIRKLPIGVGVPPGPKVLGGASSSAVAAVAGRVTCMAMSPDGSLLASAIDDFVQLRRIPSGRPAPAIGVGDPVTCLAASADGSTLLSGQRDGRVRLWELPSGKPVGTLDVTRHPGFSAHHMWNSPTAQGRSIVAIALMRDASWLVMAAGNGALLCWDFPRGRPVGELFRPRPPNEKRTEPSLAVTPDGTLAVADGLHSIRLWRLPHCEPAGDLGPKSAGASDVTVTADGALIAARVDGEVRLWRSALIDLCRTPVERIDPFALDGVDVRFEWSPGELAWLELVEALVRWRRRHDIELGDGAPPIAGGTDIEASG